MISTEQANIVPFQKISTLPYRRDWNFLEGGVGLYDQIFKECMEFPEGWVGGVLRKTLFCGRGMDIFWNYTFATNIHLHL